MLMWGYMSRWQRTVFAKSLLELANRAAATLLFGQFVSGRSLQPITLAWGLTLTAALYLGAFAFTREEDQP
jgi:hypothetical protein